MRYYGNNTMLKNKPYKRTLYTLILLLLSSHFSLLSAQVVFVPINDNVYHYLDRMNIKGVIQLDSEVKPFSRVYIAEKLIEIEASFSKSLTSVDLDLLGFYVAEYGAEIKREVKSQKSKVKNVSPYNSFSNHD